MPEIFYSKRFWAAVASIVFVFTDGFGIAVSAEQIELVIMSLAAWIVGDSLRSTPSALLSYDEGGWCDECDVEE